MCYFQVSFNLTVILSILKITQNTVTEPLKQYQIYYQVLCCTVWSVQSELNKI